MKFHQFLIHFPVFILSMIHTSCFAVNLQERDALFALKAMFNDPFLDQNWVGLQCFNYTSYWYGIGCSNGRVTAISLRSRGLTGEVTQDAFANLLELITLNFTNNSISGNMMNFSSNQKLQILDLSGNKFSGPISTSLLGLDSLQTLLLQDNKFTGPVPAFSQSSLRHANFSSNHLSGQIPETKTLQSLKADSFEDNPGLCGTPSPNACKIDNSTANVTEQVKSPSTEQVKSPSAEQSKSPSFGLTSLLVLTNVIGLVVLIIVFLLYLKKRKLEKTIARNHNNAAKERGEDKSHSEYYNESNDIKISVEEQSIVPFNSEQSNTKLIFTGNEGENESFELTDLLKASAQGLGKGVFGYTYKAMMEGRPAVVVKRLRNLRPLSKEEFSKQLRNIVSHKHPNLLPLLAYFHSEDEKFLVSKYIEKGNLFTLLHGGRETQDRIPFKWHSRLSVASSVARALEYLHQNTKPETLIPHGNLKMSNVLLDENDTVLVSDYGLIPLVAPPVAAQRMSAFKSPEYRAAKKVSKKSDVWTYGCLLLELLTGRMSAQSAPPGVDGADLCSWVRRVVREEWTMEILDPEISVQRSARDGMLKLLNLGMRCCDKVPEKRPEMAEVVREVKDIKVSESEEESSDFSMDLTDESI